MTTPLALSVVAEPAPRWQRLAGLDLKHSQTGGRVTARYLGPHHMDLEIDTERLAELLGLLGTSKEIKIQTILKPVPRELPNFNSDGTLSRFQFAVPKRFQLVTLAQQVGALAFFMLGTSFDIGHSNQDFAVICGEHDITISFYVRNLNEIYERGDAYLLRRLQLGLHKAILWAALIEQVVLIGTQHVYEKRSLDSINITFIKAVLGIRLWEKQRTTLAFLALFADAGFSVLLPACYIDMAFRYWFAGERPWILDMLVGVLTIPALGFIHYSCYHTRMYNPTRPIDSTVPLLQRLKNLYSVPVDFGALWQLWLEVDRKGHAPLFRVGEGEKSLGSPQP